MEVSQYIPVSTDQRRRVRFFWIVTMVSTVLGGLLATVGILAANGAPQQAAAAAVGCLAAVGPYVMARAVDELRR